MSAILSGFHRSALGGSNARLHHTGNFVLGTSGRSLSARSLYGPPSAARRISCLHHSTTFCGGNRWPGHYPTLYPLSYGDLHRRRDSNPQPCGNWFFEVSRAFATPQTLDLFSLPPYFLVFRHLYRFVFDPHPTRQKFREEPALTVFRDSNPKPCGCFHTKYP